MDIGLLKTKIRNGDFKILGEVLGIPSESARMKFNRKHQEAVLAMQKIISHRESIAKKVKQEISID